MLEAIAGVVEEGETDEAVAHREAAEEPVRAASQIREHARIAQVDGELGTAVRGPA